MEQCTGADLEPVAASFVSSSFLTSGKETARLAGQETNFCFPPCSIHVGALARDVCGEMYSQSNAKGVERERVPKVPESEKSKHVAFRFLNKV